MTSRSTILIALATIALGACSGSESESADTTSPEVSLITTTTEAAVFEASDEQADPVTTSEAPPAPPTSGEPPITSEVTTTTATTPTTNTDAPTDSVDGDEPQTTEDPVPTDATDASVATDAPAETDVAPVETIPSPSPTGFVLGADGLGAVAFGADPEETISFVDSLLGEPTSDTGWVAPFDIGPCGGSRIRQVSWNQLQLEFGDVSDVTTGRDHLYAYFYGAEGSSSPTPSGLSTAEGIGVGSTISELLAAYPAASLFEGDDFVGPSFSVNDNLRGRVSGIGGDDVIEVVIGGLPCDG